MVLSALPAATCSPPAPTLLRHSAERSLAVAFTSSAAVRRRRGEVKSFRGNSTKYNTTNPQTWTLTAVGDWSSWNNFSTTAETRTHGAAHELTRIGSGTTPATILYDTKGNITQNQRTPGTSSTYQNYVWDFDNRMTSADTNGDSAADVTFEFDALGRRVARTQGATAVVYIHAGQQVVCDYTRGANANTTPAFRYVWGDYIDEPILRQTGSSTLLYYHHNQQYSTVALTNSSGEVISRYGYTAYGEQSILTYTGSSQSYSSYGNRYTYTGREWDDSLKAHYFRARWYDAALGRFVNRDPIGYLDGMSLYRGHFGQSENDPFGERTIDGSGWRTKHDQKGLLSAFCDDLSPGPNATSACFACNKTACERVIANIFDAAKWTDDNVSVFWNANYLGQISQAVSGSEVYGGYCHAWRSIFIDKIGKLETHNARSCLTWDSAVIGLNPVNNWGYSDHGFNYLKNTCTGKCLIIQNWPYQRVIDPCEWNWEGNQLNENGRGEWNRVLKRCNCRNSVEAPVFDLNRNILEFERITGDSYWGFGKPKF